MLKLKSKDFLSLADLGEADLEGLLALARELKSEPRAGRGDQPLAGKALGMIFEKHSTRTRISFEVGMFQLGGHAVNLDTRSMQLDRGESIEDTARVMSRYLDGLVLRTFSHDRLTALARSATIPVINGLSDFLHPCQALADVFTINETLGRLRGVNVSYFGDGNNVAHSLMFACALTGANIKVVAPEEFQPHRSIYRLARELAEKNGGAVELEPDPEAGARGADVLYTDVWVSMGQDAERRRRLELLEPYQVNAGLLALAADDAVVMHCLPAHRGEEIAAEVMDGPRSVVFQQAENRLHVQKAVMCVLMAD